MDSAREMGFAAAGSEVPLHRNAPLAPTQELAYRKKCIQLKRRLAEIEANNDSTRKRILQETEHVQKMRLLRAILLNHLKEVMTAPAKKLTPEQLEKLGVLANGNAASSLAEVAGSAVSPELVRSRPEGEGLLDDSSEESDEDEPEVRKPSSPSAPLPSNPNKKRHARSLGSKTARRKTGTTQTGQQHELP